MTIQFNGHVTKLEAVPDGMEVHVATEQAKCGHDIVLRMPLTQAEHWLPGRIVVVTAYTLLPPKEQR